MTLSRAQTSVMYEVTDPRILAYSIPFFFFRVEDMQVLTLSAEGVETPVHSGFSIHGAQSPTGGEVVFGQALLAGTRLLLRRYSDRVQESTYPEGGRLPAKVLEHDLDRIVAMTQELDDTLTRAVLVPAGSSISPQALIRALFSARDEAVRRADEARCAEQQAQSHAGVAGVQADRANDEADRAFNEAERAHDLVRLAIENLTGLNIAVDDAPYGHMASGSYNAETGMLTLRVPEGKRGEQGLIGGQGPTGPQGGTGDIGERGDTGPQGVQGMQGPQGEIGSQGIQGLSGIQGQQGIQGAIGQQGIKGDTGDTGDTGPQGNPGVIMQVDGGLFGFEIDAEGNLLLVHNDAVAPPDMYIDSDGNLIWEGQSCQ